MKSDTSTSTAPPFSAMERRPCSPAKGEGASAERLVNPMDAERSRAWPLMQACRCGARNRRGLPCQAPAMRGKRRCAFHGGKSPGAPTGRANGRYTSGLWTQEMREARRLMRAVLQGAAVAVD